MAMTAEQFEQLTQLLGAPPAWRGAARRYHGEERREMRRMPARGPAELHVARLDRAPWQFTVYVHDVSPSGLGLLSGNPLHAGADVRVLVTNGHDDVTVRCSVRHCTALARGLYGVGVNVEEFHTSQAPLDAALDEPLAA